MKIRVKWNKENYEVDLDTSSDVATFKALLYSLTGVPSERQKLMTKGGWSKVGFVGVLKDDFDLSQTKVKEGQTVTLMGTADVVKEPVEAIKFVEDMTEEEKAEKGAVIPGGFVNLGNTCYMNSVLQCLRSMPELRQAMRGVSGASGGGGVGVSMTKALSDTWEQIDRAGVAMPPTLCLSSLHRFFPQFAQRGQQGGLMQHDAEELLNAITTVLKEGLGGTDRSLKEFMSMDLEQTLTCKESPSETPKVKVDTLDKLACSIQGGPGTDPIDHLHDGLMLGLGGEVELHAETLGRNAVWEQRSRLASLPRYICIHFMRFFWKDTPDSRDHAGVKCKIRRAVSFPNTMDVYDLCCERIQNALRANRVARDKKLDGESEAKRAKLESGAAPANDGPTDSETAGEPAETSAEVMEAPMEAADDDAEDASALEAALALSLTGDGDSTAASASASPAPTSPTFGKAIPEDFTGNYELMGVVTHKGRDADSGHYIGWVRQEPGSEYWWRYDDDKVTEVSTEEILALKGGGDWHTAYLNFYRAKI